MKIFFSIIVWVFVLVVDGVVLPTMTNIFAGMGSVIFLTTLVLVHGFHKWVVGLGLLLAVVTEVVFGIYVGSIVGSWLVILWTWHLINKFMSFKSMSEDSSWSTLIPLLFSGAVISLFAFMAQWLIARFIYSSELPLAFIYQTLISPPIFITAFLELVVLLAMFRIIYKPKKSYYVR